MNTCSACGFANREGKRFCTECGVGLPEACPGCGAAVEADEKFCGHCGHAVATVAAVGPPRATPGVGQGERKQVTVLFADVKGSMDLAEALDPEDWASVMNRFSQILSAGVTRFGGTVDKFTGDGIMAVFGAPISQEDHARRACQAALQLRSTTAAYGRELASSHGLGLLVRLGMNSGEVVVGGIGEAGQLGYTALGHTVGLAQRMEALAEPGEAFLTEHTAALVRDHFALRDLGPRAVKGATAPLSVFALVGPRRRSATTAATALVGRAGEMAVLESALARACDGAGQVVGVVGEAGVGKSRLCEEFARAVAARGISVRRATGLSHARMVPLLPVLELLRDHFQIDERDSPEAAQAKIASRVLELAPDLDEDLPVLFDFLDVPDPQRPAPRRSPEARMLRVVEVLRALAEARSREDPLVLVLEDLHWFDPQSLAFTTELIPTYTGTRTLVLANFRPELTVPWATHPQYSELVLGPLDTQATAHLFEGLLGHDTALGDLAGLIAERTGGYPFFVEEVVRALVEDGTLAGQPGSYRLSRSVETLRVPATVQATLAARIDRASEADKAVLQAASVIGRQFNRRVLARVCGLADDDLAAALGRLGAAEFVAAIDESTTAGEYRFWHPLTQEVAYGGLLRERRAKLHAATAAAILATEPARLDERAALLAAHWDAAGEHWQAAQWSFRAGDHAFKRDLAESMRRFRATVEHLRTVEGEDATRLGVRARSRLARYGARSGMDDDELAGHICEVRALNDRLDDARLTLEMDTAVGAAYFWRGRLGEGIEVYLHGAEWADRSGDPALITAAHYSPAVACWFTGPVSTGLASAEQSLRAGGGDPDAGVGMLGFGTRGPAMLGRARLLGLAGERSAAGAGLDEATRILRERAETEWLVWALAAYAELACSADELEAALGHGTEGLQIAEDTGHAANRIIALRAIGAASLGLGRLPEAIATLEQGLSEARTRKVGLMEEGVLLTHLALAHLGAGDRTQAPAIAAEAVTVAHRQGARIVECKALLDQARIGRALDRPLPDVQRTLDEALRLARLTEAAAYESEIRAEQAKG